MKRFFVYISYKILPTGPAGQKDFMHEYVNQYTYSFSGDTAMVRDYSNLSEADRLIAEEIDREFEEELIEEENAIEAILFVSGDPVSITQIAKAMELSVEAAKKAITRLAARYEKKDSGLQIKRYEDFYQLRAKKKYYNKLVRIVKARPEPKLTPVMLEVLSIIAYKQPVTKAEIERIRGVNSDNVVNKLVGYGIVEEVGHLQTTGRSAQFGTTIVFLRQFGLSSIEELPKFTEEQENALKKEIEEGLYGGNFGFQ